MRAFACITLSLAVSLLAAVGTVPLHAQDGADPAGTQDDPPDPAQEYEERFRHGIQALADGRYGEGIADFERCLEIAPVFPQNAICAYNIACGYSKLEEIDEGFAWLERCATMGFGQQANNIAHSAQDADLENCRAETERWQAFVTRMTTINERLAEYAATPAVYVPEALAELEEKPVLVVLHEYGQKKEDVLVGEFKQVADELGMVLVAPAAGYALHESDPAQGMSWWDDVNAYVANTHSYLRKISEAMRYVRDEVGMDRSRVLIAGVGQGAILAFNAAVSSPGLYKGVVSVGYDPRFLELAQSSGPNAGRMGLKVRFVFAQLPEADMDAWVAQNLIARIEPWGLDAGHRLFAQEAPEEGASYQEALVAVLRECLPSAEPSDL